MDRPEIPPFPSHLEIVEPMPAPTPAYRSLLALVFSAMVVTAFTGSCVAFVMSKLPAPEATVERAQEVVEEFVSRAASGNTDSMAELLSEDARKTMDEAVLRSISEYIKTRVGVVSGFSRTGQEVLEAGAEQRVFLSVNAGGSIGKIHIRATLEYSENRWLIEEIEII